MTQYKHWQIEQDADLITWVYFDKQYASVNTIDKEVMEEFSLVIDDVSQQRQVKGLVIASRKKTGFIAGADIAQFTQFNSIQEAEQLLKLGQYILSKVESMSIPTVALIDGFCLGGGLELALACRYRIAEESSKTRIGLPEVKLGIHPGWGGTVRLPRLLGAPNALNMILNGHTVTGKTAAKLGLADVAVPRRQLISAAKYYILQKPEPRRLSWWQSLLDKKLIS